MPNYVGRTNKHGQIDIIRADEAHLPHILVSWYDWGLGTMGVCAVYPGETHDQAADRAFPASKSAKWRKISDPNWVD